MALSPPTPSSPAGSPQGGPPPSAAGGSPADRAASAAADVVNKQREAIDATYPQKSEPVSVSEVSDVSKCVAKVVKALDGPDLPVWEAPKGVREVPAVPIEVYRAAMLVLMMAARLLPPEKAGQFTVAPSDFTSDKGLSKVCGILSSLAGDKKLIKAMHEGTAKMGAAPAQGEPVMSEEAEGEPNPDKKAPPHMEPDMDDDYTAM